MRGKEGVKTCENTSNRITHRRANCVSIIQWIVDRMVIY